MPLDVINQDPAGSNPPNIGAVPVSDVTTTPAANKIPRAGGSGKIADGWLSNLIARVADLTWGNLADKPTTFPPGGGAGGVLSGTYPNPGFAVDMATQAELDAHTGNTSNPHAVTKAQVGLGNVDDTSDADKPISTATETALAGKEKVTEYKTAAFTASIGVRYNCNFTGSVTAPTGAVGGWFEVYVQGGSVTVGGTAYALAGTVITATWNGSAWVYDVKLPDSQKADMPRIENRHTMRDWANSIYSLAANPGAKTVALAYYGDSIANLVSEEMVRIMTNFSYLRCDLSYPSAMQTAPLVVLSGTALVYDGRDKVVQAGNNNGAGGYRDFTYVPTGAHMTLANGSVVTWDSSERTGIDRVVAFFVKGPGFGSVVVDLLNRADNSVISTVNLDLSGATIEGAKADFLGVSRSTKYKLRITSTGVTVFCHISFLQPWGIMPLNVACGGSSFTQNNYSYSQIFKYICEQLNTGLIFCSAKEEAADQSMTATMERLAVLTSCSKLVSSSMPDTSNAENQELNRDYFREAALSAGFAFFDGYAAVGSSAEMLRLGWLTEGDGTHPTNAANRFVAGLIMSEFSDILAVGGLIVRSLDNVAVDNTYVATRSLKIGRGDNTGGSVEVMRAAGGGSPATVTLQNLYRLSFGQADGGNQGYLGGYGDNTLAVYKNDFGWGDFIARTYQAMRNDDYAFVAEAGGIRLGGNVDLTVVGKGVIMKSPDGTRYKITVANGGALSAVAV